LKADINQLNLPHGTKTKNVDKKLKMDMLSKKYW